MRVVQMDLKVIKNLNIKINFDCIKYYNRKIKKVVKGMID